MNPIAWLVRRGMAVLRALSGSRPVPQGRGNAALVGTLNAHSGFPNPVWVIPEVEWQRLEGYLQGPVVQGLEGDTPFTLGCVIVNNYGGVPNLPDRIIVGSGLFLETRNGQETHRGDSLGLYQWLLDSAEDAGLGRFVDEIRGR